MSYQSLVAELTELTQAQLEAAKALDTAALNAATQARADLLFELEIELQDGVPEQERAALRPQVEALVLLEKRVNVVVSLVSGSLDQLVSYESPIYGRPSRQAG